MAQSKVANMINPEVMADMISAELPQEIKFYPLAEVDDTLVGQPGNTVTVPKWNYIGDAAVVAEGQPIDLKLMTTSNDQATIKKVAQGVELTDESVLSGLGDPVGQGKNQILKSIAAGVDNDILAAVASTPLNYSATAWNVDAVDSALALFNDESDEPASVVLFMNPKDAVKLRKVAASDWTRATDLGDQILIKGTFGELLGAQIIRSKKLAEGTGYLVKKGAIKLYMKRGVEVETDRDIQTKSTVITGDQHFTAHLYDESKAIKITVAP